MNDSIRYDVSLAIRILRSLPTLGIMLGIAILIVVMMPRDIQLMSMQSMAILGIIGVWRYLWLLTHVVRSVLYEHWMYPKLRFEALQLPEETRYPERLFFVVPSFREQPDVSKRSLNSVIDEAHSIPSEVTIFVNAGSEEEDQVFRDAHLQHQYRDSVNLEFIRQDGGKRQGMADVLTELGYYNVGDNDIVALMDGDTLLGNDILKKCLPLFVLKPRVGAITTDNIAVTSGNSLYRKWYTLRFSMRHRMMKSQSLSSQLMVLTGRFSLVRAKQAVDPEFIMHLENDRIQHWLHGEIKFVTGDDKSTWYALLKKGCEMLYVPDAHIYCMEDSGTEPLTQSIKKMHRWFGNMLRNNGRGIKLGVGAQKGFIWWCLVDQRVSMFTSLMGPIAAIWSAIWISWHYLLIYIVLVILVRSSYLMLLVVEGHRISITDIPMLLYTQWIGSIVKIYTLFHLHKQKWDSHRTNLDSVQQDDGVLISLIPKLEMVLCYFVLVLMVASMIGFK